MSGEFFILLSEFIVKEEFTAERLKDAVNHTIANFQYKELNISDIVGYDRRLKLYTPAEVHKLKGSYPHPDFKRKEIDGKMFWLLKADLIRYGYKAD